MTCHDSILGCVRLSVDLWILDSWVHPSVGHAQQHATKPSVYTALFFSFKFIPVLGDIFFLRSMRDPSRPARPVILFLDAFSRMAYASIIATTSSQQVLKHLDAAFLHFGGKYRKFASDRGMERDKTSPIRGQRCGYNWTHQRTWMF